MKLDRYLQITLTYIGAVIGAGFASGQEILQFFITYGTSGLSGIILAGLLFIILGSSIVLIGYDLELPDYQSLFYQLGGSFLGLLADIFLTLFLLGSLIVMLAGCKEIFNYFFTLEINLGLIITLIIIAIANYYGLNGIMKLNSLFTPILILISLVVVINLNNNFGLSLEQFSLSMPAIVSSFVYAGYNTVLGIVVLLPLTTKIKKQEMILGIFTGGIILGLIALLIGYNLYYFFDDIAGSEMPMLELVSKYKVEFHYIYGVVLWCAMITTASCNLYGLTERIKSIINLSRGKLVIIILAIILPVVNLSFSHLVELIYPWLGKISLSLVAGLMIVFFGKKVYKGSGDYGH
ncbi:putative membrane protein [Halobacteroides halobius DSM 5150]|uniref:Putative membrane protein n=1 Tax=Halobacteroides halobius (strain ATCC 35273 / DSM 5150 / MD-1) TaxID=748449 RepID=L0KB09_HALHC|nr:hypothetical protein [Halobacteroides halobius]AGB42487.1 putative membrane protein [Halobacteroides halobius DSM 5150]